MYSPNKNKKSTSPNAKIEKNSSPEERILSPNSKRLVGFKPKQLSDLKPIKPGEKSIMSPISKHERSFSGLYSKFMQHKTYSENHEVGYSAEEIKDAVNFIFLKYDTNKDGLLDRAEVKKLIENSLKHMGSTHIPTEGEIINFIYSMDKNNDGKLSKIELENAFKRANKIEY